MLASATTTRPAGLTQAYHWLALMDQQRWQESWNEAAPLFQARITAEKWTERAQSLHQSIGTVSSRRIESVTSATSLPGAPDGHYEVIRFQADFTRKAGAIETLAMAYTSSQWRVVGYYVR